MQCCGAGAATFRVEPEPIFLLAGTESRSRFFKAAPERKKGKPCSCDKHDFLRAIYVNMIQKRLALIIHF